MRGQAHTLEGFAAALLVVSGVTFALQATAVTPLSASTSNQHIENQERAVAADLLAAAEAEGTLRETLTHWNTDEDRFVNATVQGFYVDGNEETPFLRSLNETFGPDRIAFNVFVRFQEPGSDARDRQPLVYMGSPSDNAVTASRSVVVFDDRPLSSGPGTVGAAAADNDFYAPDADPDGPLFNVMEVRIVVWRI